MLALGAMLAVTGAAAATGNGPGDVGAVDALLHDMGSASSLLGQQQAAKAHADYVRRLRETADAIRGCGAFLDRYGSDRRVARIVSRLREKPGGGLFTTPRIVADLEQATGRPLELSQFGIELCAQVQDRLAGASSAGAQSVPFRRIAGSLRKCEAALDAVGPDRAGVTLLQRLRRGIGDETFTSPARLAALEAAVGARLHLTPAEFETCVDAYDVHARLENTFVGDNPPPCGPDEEFCSGVSGTVCCSSGEVCTSSCVRSTCNAGCVPQWCFPADATVQLEDGSTKAMPDVRLGDRVLVARGDGSPGFEDVYLNTHKDRASAAPYVELLLASGRRLSLSPRHFIPVAAGPDGTWQDRVAKGADELMAGDHVWSRSGDGAMRLDLVLAARTRVAIGAFNPLTMNGTIVVDGVVASAHSDWFLDGLVSADAQTRVYQAILAPARLAYRVLGPERMETVTERWGLVDTVRTASTPRPDGNGAAWILGGLALIAATGVALVRRRRRPALMVPGTINAR